MQKLWERAHAFAISKGMGDEAEDFAQECLIKAAERGQIKLEWVYSGYRQFLRTDKRILSSAQGHLSGFRTISLDAPIDSSDADSAKLGDFIGDSRNDLESIGEFEFYEELLEMILSCVSDSDAKSWAKETYLKYLENEL